MPAIMRVNLGGEGEEPGVLNQQPPFALGPNWFSWRHGGMTLQELEAVGLEFVICDNENLLFGDNSVDVVYTNNVPIDRDTKDGPGVQSSEAWRILKPGGKWVHNGQLIFAKLWPDSSN
jgi:hypothetical protein